MSCYLLILSKQSYFTQAWLSSAAPKLLLDVPEIPEAAGGAFHMFGGEFTPARVNSTHIYSSCVPSIILMRSQRKLWPANGITRSEVINGCCHSSTLTKNITDWKHLQRDQSTNLIPFYHIYISLTGKHTAVYAKDPQWNAFEIVVKLQRMRLDENLMTPVRSTGCCRCRKIKYWLKKEKIAHFNWQ